MSIIGIRKLDKNDKDYHQIIWKRKRFLERFWERMYTEGDMSWQEIFDYLGSDDFTKDVIQDIFNIAHNEVSKNNNNL